MYKGKAIYNPSGKAGEYSYWACNTHVGCSHGCTYCYLKKGRGAKILGGNIPKLKKCFKSNDHAIQVFGKELLKNLDELQKHGLFFSFTTDPFSFDGSIDNPVNFIKYAVGICSTYNVPVKLLTKSGGDWLVEKVREMAMLEYWKRDIIAIGFTLTGHDELEPNASTNKERIYAMSKLKASGFKTFASIEPIIDFASSYKMFVGTLDICDLYKIGLESGKSYSKDDAIRFISNVIFMASSNNVKVYFKDSLLKLVGYERNSLHYDCCVERDYNLFKD